MPDILYQISELQQRYAGRIVLQIPYLEILRGEVFALVGPSGAGKSTFLRLLAMLEAPTSGKLQLHVKQKTLFAKNLSTADRRQLTMVFQRAVLLSRSVRANVAYGLALRGDLPKSEINTRVDAILQALALDHLAHASAKTLSGGEAQRVAMARALVLEPSVLLLDEATANLDPHNVKLLETLIREQHERTANTVILVTHNIFQAKRLADRVGFVLDGDLVEVAPVDEFMNHPQDSRTAAFLSGDLVY